MVESLEREHFREEGRRGGWDRDAAPRGVLCAVRLRCVDLLEPRDGGTAFFSSVDAARRGREICYASTCSLACLFDVALPPHAFDVALDTLSPLCLFVGAREP